MRNKQHYILQNIDCPVCAANIEAGVAKIEGVRNASVNYPAGHLFLDIDEGADAALIYSNVRQTVKSIELDADIVAPSEKASEGKNKKIVKEVIPLACGVILYAGACLSIVAQLPQAVGIALFILSFLAAGLKVVIRAVRNVISGRMFDESLLMSIATIGAFAVGKFEEGAAVMLFYGVGELLEDIASSRSAKSIEAAMDLRPDYVNLIMPDGTKRVSPEQVSVSDIFEVRPGEKVPLDGTVERGESYVDTKAITGEPVPRWAAAGSEVLAGFVNQSGLLTVRAGRAYAESSAAKTLELIRQADGKKAKAERFISRFARYYTPTVVVAALITAFVLPLVLAQPFSLWVYRALTFLVVSCPCALVISVPLSAFAGIGAASKAGILVKGGSPFESMANVDAVLFDKTGTLTQGVFEVVKTLPAEGVTPQTLLETAAAAEAGSNHPVARSIQKAAGVSAAPQPGYDFAEIPGSGVKASFHDKTILAGNERLMQGRGIAYEKCGEPGTLVYVAQDDRYLGCIVVADVVKSGSIEAINALKKLGVHNLVMVTGDNPATAQATAAALGITQVHAGLLPEQKAAVLAEYKSSANGTVMFAGDGINDAPVIAGADVGVAMGGMGSDAAVEAADAVIVDDNPLRIADAVVIARHTKAVILQNVIFALAIKFGVLALTAIGISTMWEAVFADVGVALIAILNAIRVLLKRGYRLETDEAKP